ncbi:winged helix-turn-helix domain-containing protein [Streptomyces sp. NBRC 110035]|uniref:GntR family transcriptional regulator n=1 Tax=Streptomyces sp. NBRC 110035 TaxID=1547867 RepID=UPI0005A74C39|nr:winged helix-turn-helix domain-containing protein [Streptomyces sp. NBRC 110035]
MVVTQENVAVNGNSRNAPQRIADVLRERIRAGELRAGERLPTQAELAEEFGVERGVVRRALRVLADDGLLSNVSKGSPPRIAEPAPASDEPRPTMVGLAPRLTDAFRAAHVRIDVVSHTSETLMVAVGEPVRLIHEGRLRPESIEFRVLLPSRTINLAFPVLVAEGAEDADGGGPVHERWLQMRNAQAQVLQHNLQSVRHTHGIDVHVRFRALPFTPPMKLYLLNGQEALLGYYLLARREEEWGTQTLDMYDALGSQSLLFSFARQAGRRDQAFVEESQKWFDALWETITTDLTLSQ